MAIVPTAPAPPPLCFIHIPKTAGTTLHKILSHQYPRTFIRHDSEGPWDDAAVAALTAARPQVVMGHLSVGLHEKIPGVRYLTCLREPIARIISHYHHALHDPAHYLHHEVVSKNLTLTGYALSGLSGELDNGMTRMIAGVPDFHQSTVTAETLELAKANLRHHFDAVLLSESFDSGLILLADDLRWRTPWYIRRKVGNYSPATPPPDAAARRAIAGHNRFDVELHAWATARCAARAAAISDHQERVSRFQQANRSRGKLIFCLRELRHRCPL